MQGTIWARRKYLFIILNLKGWNYKWGKIQVGKWKRPVKWVSVGNNCNCNCKRSDDDYPINNTNAWNNQWGIGNVQSAVTKMQYTVRKHW